MANSGPGVPVELRDRIFDPFYTTKPVGAGTGLGLSICHSIIVESGGTIELESSEQGASFCIRLPVAALSPDSEQVATPAAAASSLPNLLVVDDEPAVRHMLSRALKKQFSVEQASSGREALERVEAGAPFDLILCDVMMPEVTGLDVLERLREVAPGMVPRLVFATGGSFSDEVREEMRRDGVEVVRKPIEVGALREQLAQRLDELAHEPV